jgi:abelson tyrosine-protein kinase 1
MLHTIPIPKTPAEIRSNLRTLHAFQNEIDQVKDIADLRQLMRMALGTTSDAEMIDVLQVGRDEMPEAIKTLQRALEKEVRSGSSEGRKASVVGAQTQSGIVEGEDTAGGIRAGLERKGTRASRESGGSSSGKDTLDREFIESGIDVLRRMSKGAESLPSWTITR